MITKQVIVNDEVLEVKYETEKVQKYFENKSFDVQFFVRYDQENNCVYVDEGAPEWYKLLAALHEMICCGHSFNDLVPKLNEVDDEHRCACVEKFVIDLAGEYREKYISARILMFTTLLDQKLCSKENRRMIEKTLEYLTLAL